MPRLTILAAALALGCALPGCQTARQITLRSELENLVDGERIRVYLRNQSEVEFVLYDLTDSTLVGTGMITPDDRLMRVDRRIPLDSIAAICVSSTSVRKGALGLVMAGAMIATMAAFRDDDIRVTGLDEYVARRYPHSGGGSGQSCPYVYAWDGDRYVLEAEPFGVGFGRALELTTHHLLPSVQAENGVVRLRLTNERPETHYVNSLRVFAIETGGAAEVVLDADGVAWPVRRRIAPVVALDAQGRDLLPSVAEADGAMWECPESDLRPGSAFEDRLDLSFVCPAGTREGLLVLSGTNTAFSSVVFEQLSLAAGDQALALACAIDSDPEMIARLREYLEDASLQVAVWDGVRWVAAGAFRPEANAISFQRALRIPIPEGTGDTVRVRLRSMADVWRIDALTADWSMASPLPANEVDMISAIGPDGRDLRPLLGANDDRYAVLWPPDRVELRFAAREVTADAASGPGVVYAIAGRGYLHEWIASGTPTGAALLASQVPREQRIDFIKQALRHRDAVLESAYGEWVERRE